MNSIKYFYKNINLALILGIIFFIPIFFIPQIFNSFILPKIVLFRFLLLLLLFFYVLKVILNNKISLLNNKLLIFFFALSLSIFLSSLLSNCKIFSVWGAYNRQTGLYSYFSFFLFFLLIISIIKNKDQIEKIIYTIIGSSFLVSLYAIIQYLGFDFFSWSETPSVTGRAFSSLGQPNFLGHFLAINIPIIIFSLVFLTKKKLYKFLVFLVLLLNLSALVVSLSRAAWLALFFGLVFSFLVFLIIKKKKVLASYLSIVLLLLVVLLAFNYGIKTKQENNMVDSANVSNRIVNLLNFNQGSGRMRINYWQASLSELKEANIKTKLFGYGGDSLKDVFVEHYEKEWGVHETINTYPDQAHNLILDILLHFGLFGLLAFSFFIGFIFLNVFKYLKNNEKSSDYWLLFSLTTVLFIYFFNNLLSFSNISTYIYFYLYLAIICLIVFKDSRKEIKINLSTVSKYLIILFLFIFCLSFIFFKNINLVYADYYYIKSLDSGYNSSQKCLKTFNFINKSLKYNPDNIFYKKEYIRYGLNCYYSLGVYNKNNWLDNDLLDIIKNTKGQKNNYSYKLYEARIYSILSQKDNIYYTKAEKIYKDLIAKSPYITTPYKELAKLKMQAGNDKEAIFYLKKAVEVSPLVDNEYLNKEHRKELEDELNSINSILNSFQYQGSKN